MLAGPLFPGVLGLVASWMLRVPALGTYHTDFPAYAAIPESR